MDIEKQVGAPEREIVYLLRRSTALAGRREGHRCPVAPKVRARGAFLAWSRREGGQANVTEMLETAERDSPAAPSPIVAYLESLLERHAATTRAARSRPTSPSSRRADPELFGICLVTVDGAVYEAGDTRQQFTIQSMSKPFTYGLALELAGAGRGAPPSRRRAERRPVQRDQPPPRDGHAGEPDDQCRRDHVRRARARPRRGSRSRRCFERTRATRAAGLRVDEAVYRSEAETGHRNRAIAHLLRSFDVLLERPGGRGRPLLPPVLGLGRLPRPRVHRGDARRRRRQPAHRRARGARGASSAACSA